MPSRSPSMSLFARYQSQASVKLAFIGQQKGTSMVAVTCGQFPLRLGILWAEVFFYRPLMPKACFSSTVGCDR